jgi:hypothetical protein
MYCLLRRIMPFLPYLKDKEKLSETYIFYETLHLDYEKLWAEFEKNEDEEKANDKYFELKNKELTILDKIKDFKVNNYKKIERLVRIEWADYLQTNFNTKIDI